MQYRQILAGSAMVALAAASPTPVRRDAQATVTGAAAVTEINNSDGTGDGSFSAYVYYSGNGSPAAGWPTKDQWVSFDNMFNNNKDAMRQSCNGQVDINGAQVPLNSEDEINQLYTSINQVAQASGVDHRLILASIMQESHGCVRVATSAYSVNNPGLMQDYNGYYTCNDTKNTNHGGAVMTPCPEEYITGMVSEGSRGTDAGPGFATDINQAQDVNGCTDAQCFYMGARIYNSGSIPASGDLSEGGSTSSYASDIANRLLGYVN